MAVAESGVDQGAAFVGVGVISLVAACIVGAAIWGFLRLRSVQPVLRNALSDNRAERFASQMLREFLPDVQQDTAGPLEPAPGPAATSNIGPSLADEALGGGVRVLENFYASTLTSKPVRTAGPATGTLTSRSSRPELSGEFGEWVREFAEGIQSLAKAVEQAALVGGGSELDRAARSVEAFTTGLGTLPIKAILVTAGKSVELSRQVRRGGPYRTGQGTGALGVTCSAPAAGLATTTCRR